MSDELSTPAFNDGYLGWAVATSWAGHSAMAGSSATARVPLLVCCELDSKGTPVAPTALSSSAHWRRADAARWRYRTGWASSINLVECVGQVTAMAMSLPIAAPPEEAPITRGDAGGTAGPLVIGVIDNQCAFLNQTFRRPDGQGTRLVSVWDQGEAANGHGVWRTPDDFGYGRRLDRAAIDAVLYGLADAHPQAEWAAYRSLGYLVDNDGNPSDEVHGTHVLDIAAGCVLDDLRGANAKPSSADAASNADLVFVDVPTPRDGDTTGAAADAYILDAVHHVLNLAAADSRVIVNISVGALAGPHDGHSLLETALDELMEKDPRLAITVAAGNAALERWHAVASLGPQAASTGRLTWRTMPGDATDSFLELWLLADRPDTPGSASDQNPALRALTVTLHAPDGRMLSTTLGHSAQLRAEDGTLQARVEVQSCQRGGRAVAGALVSLAATAASGSRRAGLPGGLWQIEVACGGLYAPLAVQAWLQRDTPLRRRDPVLQSELESVDDGWQVDGHAALSSLSTGSRTVVVGAACASDGRRSAYCPSVGLTVLATADESAATRGLLCSDALSGTSLRMSGTSAAAPMVARALANRSAAGKATGGPSDWRAIARACGRLGAGESLPVVRPSDES